MADRLVEVTIRANVANALNGFAKIQAASEKAGTAAKSWEKVSQSATTVGTAFTGVGAAAVAAVALTVKSAADFEAAMSKVQAATNASASQMDKFRNQALTAGAEFGYTAEQVTEAQTELGKAGLSATQILGGGLRGTLALAASDNIDLAKATQIASVAMKQFGKDGSDIPHIADLLAAGAGKALGGVEQLGDALNQSGLVANNFGLSIEETTGILSAFADNGLLGSDAGTSLKTMLQALANPSKQSAELMKTLGINVKDANGQFLGAADLAQLLHDKLGDLTQAQQQQALAQIFGSDATRAATVLFKEAGDGIQKYIDQNNDAGYAVEQAAIKNNNLVGDLKKLRSAFQSGLIDAGTSADSALRPLVQTVTNVLKAVNSLPEPLKATALGTTAVVGGVSLLAGGFLLAAPKIVEFSAALKVLAASNIPAVATAAGAAQKALSGMGKGVGATAAFLTGPFGLALASAALAVKTFDLAASSGSASQKELASAIANTVSAASLLRTAGQRSDLSKFLIGDVQKQLEDIPALLKSGTDSSTRFWSFLSLGAAGADQKNQQALKSLKEIGTQLGVVASTSAPAAAKSFTQLAESQNLSNAQMKQLIGSGAFADYRAELVSQADALGISHSQTNLLLLATGQYEQAAAKAKDPTKENAAALSDLSSEGEDAAQAVTDVANALAALTSPALNARDAQRQFEAAIDAVTDTIAQNKEAYKDAGTSMDIHTEEGRKNQAALDAIASSAQNVASKLYEQTGSQEQATSAMQAGRDAVIAAAKQYGITGDAAQKLADTIIGTPTEWATTFKAETSDAASKTDDLKNKVRAVPSAKETKLKGDINDAKAKLKDLQSQLATVPRSKSTKLNAEVAAAKANLSSLQAQLNTLQSKTITVTTVNNNLVADGSKGKGLGVMKASGGYIAGPGTGTSDSIPAMLSNGEYVIQASSVSKYGTPFLDRVNAGHYADGGLVQRFAAGGKPKPKPAPKPTYTYNSGGNFSFTLNRRAGQYDGMSGVSELISMWNNSSLPPSLRNQSVRAALQYQLSMQKLSDQSDAAASKLSDLKSSAASLKTSVANAVGQVDVGGYRSAAGLKSGLARSAQNVTEFANLLTTLSKKGINGNLLAEIASLGTTEGLPLARSLAKASAADIKSINASYASIQSTAGKAGQTVADANYKAQIAAADKNAKSLEAQIAKQSKAIQGIIAKGFGLKGYASGGYTGDGHPGQVAGVVHGREYVMNQYATQRNRAVLEAMNSGATVRYMDPTPVRSANEQPQPMVARAGNNYYLSVQDPTAVAQAIERRERSEYA